MLQCVKLHMHATDSITHPTQPTRQQTCVKTCLHRSVGIGSHALLNLDHLKTPAPKPQSNPYNVGSTPIASPIGVTHTCGITWPGKCSAVMSQTRLSTWSTEPQPKMCRTSSTYKQANSLTDAARPAVQHVYSANLSPCKARRTVQCIPCVPSQMEEQHVNHRQQENQAPAHGSVGWEGIHCAM